MLVTACRLAISPTRTSPFLANATTDGVVRPPSALAMIVGSPPSRTATAELVVPRSMPTARAISFLLYDEWSGERCSPLCCCGADFTSSSWPNAVSYTHLRAHETRHDLVCRL